MSNLHSRWAAAWKEVGGSVAMGGILFEGGLNLRFQEVWRHYYGLSHIETMLDELDAFRAAEESKMVHFAAVKMMVWYHDAVYYPYAPRNDETQSARLFALVGKLAYLQEPFITRVVEGILATANRKQSENSNIRTLCDIDLAILGQPEPVFDRYKAREYALSMTRCSATPAWGVAPYLSISSIDSASTKPIFSESGMKCKRGRPSAFH